MAIRIKLIPKDDELIHGIGGKTHKYIRKYISKKSGKWVYVYDGDRKNPDDYKYTLKDEKGQPMSVTYKTDKNFKDNTNLLRYIDDTLKKQGFKSISKFGKPKYDYSDIKNVTIREIITPGTHERKYRLTIRTKGDEMDHELWIDRPYKEERDADLYVERNYVENESYNVGGGGRKSTKR